jgi:GntR family transcriptional regulator
MDNETMFPDQLRDKNYKTSVPIYIQIAESLLAQIETGELTPDERLPSERDLSNRLNVSRMTLRAALRELDSRGLLVRRPGDGTYIAEPKIERHADKLVPFTLSMQKRGYKINSKLIVFEQRLANVSMAERLHVPVSTPVYFCQRVRQINQEPVLLENCTMPVEIFPEFGKYDLEKRSLYEIMETEYGVIAHHSEQSLEAVLAADYEVELLQVSQGAPLMLERRLGYDQNNRPFEHGHDLYRGDRFRFFTEIAPLEALER